MNLHFSYSKCDFLKNILIYSNTYNILNKMNNEINNKSFIYGNESHSSEDC